MAEGTSSGTSVAIGFSHLPIARQLGLLIGLAASVAIGIAVAFWAMEPNYRPLYSDLSSRDSSEILDVLQKAGITYKLDRHHGSVMVSAGDVHDARMKVAAAGLPHGTGTGFEMFENEGGFGSSQFMETARYRHALEGELARTISNFRSVKSARVHLAVPKQSAFIRNRRKPTASVFVDLYSGRKLSHSKVAAIVHMVASSVPELTSEHVTLVDDAGHLLTDGEDADAFASADRLLNYKHQVEMTYAAKIQDLLGEIIGTGKVKARVSADIDFTQFEETKESFNPKSSVVRSEQSLQETKGFGAGGASGVPGALSNSAPKNSNAEGGATTAGAGGNDSRVQSTKNFEIDKMISHKQDQPGKLKRLTVAVVLDNMDERNEKTGKVTTRPLTQEEIDKYTALVKDAVGFDSERGDSINIMNSVFAKPEMVEPLPEPGLFEQDWVWNLLKQSLAGLFLLIFIFGVLRPILKSLAAKSADKSLQLVDMNTGQVAGMPGGAMVPGMAGGAGGFAGGGGDDELAAPGELQSYEDHMRILQDLANKDPKRVAQVVKTWVE